MNQEYISIQHLSKKFDKDFVLKDVNAVLDRGEILGFLGAQRRRENNNYQDPDRSAASHFGEAEVLGIPCDRIDERIYEQIGIVTDTSGVYERMTVYDNLKYFARLLNVSLSEIDPLLKRIGMYEQRKKNSR